MGYPIFTFVLSLLSLKLSISLVDNMFSNIREFYEAKFVVVKLTIYIENKCFPM